EPSIGLHARDRARLADLCGELAHAGNTVVIVEHDRGFIEAADWIVEVGPGSGERGGEIVFAGALDEFRTNTRSLTARYLTGREAIPAPFVRRAPRRVLVLTGAREPNLKQVTLRPPPQAPTRGLSAGAVSVDGPGGRCEACQGDGFQKLEMYFFEDIYVTCEACEGRRYGPEVLRVAHRGRNISQVLQLTVDDALGLFA